ncbi:MAG: plastocyanin/azurin family copper-binding protein [Parvularculaceae bacterium]
MAVDRREAWAAAGALLIGASAVGGVVAQSNVLEISQKDRRFAPEAVSLAPGEVLRVLNDDRFIHHVYYEAGAKEFDSGDQRPGETIELRFDEPGAYDVRCAIHPKMKLRVTVGERGAGAYAPLRE